MESKENYRKLVIRLSREKLKVRVFKELGWLKISFVWLLSGAVIWLLSPQEFISLLYSFVPPTIWVTFLYLDYVFYKVPEEIFNEQQKITRQYESRILKIDILGSQPIYDPPGLEILAMSSENKKIIELEAILRYVHQFTYSHDKESLYENRVPIGNPLATETEIRPDKLFIIELATLSQEIIADESYHVTFGRIKDTFVNFSEESIYRANFKISGKLEGETEFRSVKKTFELYAHPERTFIDSFAEAEGMERDNQLFSEYSKRRVIND